MNPKFFEPILLEPLSSLGLSRDFVLVTELLGFHTLADLLELHMTELLVLPGFDHRLWNEFVGFLEEKRMGHYLN